MTALSADRNTKTKAAGLFSYPVDGGSVIYKGSMVCLNSLGYAVPAADTSGYSNVIGIADEKVDNSAGADGALSIRVVNARAALFAATSITQAMVGTEMYVVDDQTVDDVAGVSNSIRAGILVAYVSSTSGWVLFDKPHVGYGTIGTSDLGTGAVTAAKLSSTLKTGHIPLPLTSFRITATNDIAASGTADGGVISLDTDPTLKRVNGATDKQLRIAWAANSVVEITTQFAYPADLDDTAAVVVHLLMGMATGGMDTPTVAVSYWEGVGDTNAGGNTAALSTTVGDKTVSINASDIGAAPKAATIGIIPGTHANEAVYLYAAWISYTRA